MKVLFIGGTGNISMEITRNLARQGGYELYLLNRGLQRQILPDGVHTITADIRQEEVVAAKLSGMEFDVVADFIAFTPEDVSRDIRLFKGKTRQYLFISSASAYQKPLSNYLITESTPLSNPYWQYSRDKISCEELLMKEYRENGFPVTIVRPSHTYGDGRLPLGVKGETGSWSVVERMLKGKPVVIQGDGSSLWTVTHSADFAKGFIGLMGNLHAIGEALHITSDESLTWNQIYELIANALGVKLLPLYVPTDFLTELRPEWGGNLLGDKSNTVVFDNTKLKRLVPGFYCATRFDQGVRRCVDYLMAHPELQQPDPEFDAWCDALAEVRRAAIQKMRKR